MLLIICSTIFLIAFNKNVNGDCDIPSETKASGHFFVQQRTNAKLCSGDLIFEDQFENFDLSKWQHEVTLAGGGNWEFEYYLNNRTNSFTKEGNLHIGPAFLADDYGEDFLYHGVLDVNGGSPADICTNAAFYGCSRTGSEASALNPIGSARIRAVESFSFQYGTVEVRAKLPSGDWLWPAVWLLPRYNSYGTWPASGEIDLLESRGNKNLQTANGVQIGTQQVSSALHWGPAVANNRYDKTHFEKNDAAGFDADFHIYKLVWTSKGLEFFIDGECVGTVQPPEGGFWQWGEFAGMDNPWACGTKMAPFDQQFYLVINLATGGTNSFFPDDAINGNGEKPWINTSPTASTDFWKARDQWVPTWNLGTDDSHLIVDYVKIYAA